MNITNITNLKQGDNNGNQNRRLEDTQNSGISIDFSVSVSILDIDATTIEVNYNYTVSTISTEQFLRSLDTAMSEILGGADTVEALALEAPVYKHAFIDVFYEHTPAPSH